MMGMRSCSNCGRYGYVGLETGLCEKCLKKAADALVTPERLREHPDLRDLDLALDRWYR